MPGKFRVKQIDHVELIVPDRYEAARWYKERLGLQILSDFEAWAEDPGGPLMISSDGGSTKLALFSGEPQQDERSSGFWRVAFVVDGQGFLAFLNGLETMFITTAEGNRLTREAVVDHDKAFSIYFVDPWGHRLEITTYDYNFVESRT